MIALSEWPTLQMSLWTLPWFSEWSYPRVRGLPDRSGMNGKSFTDSDDRRDGPVMSGFRVVKRFRGFGHRRFGCSAY